MIQGPRLVAMSKKPRVLLLNGTCLDVVAAHGSWLDQWNIELVADDAFRDIPPDQLTLLLREADGIIGPAAHSLTPDLLSAAPRLRVVSLAASGYDGLDLQAATDRGIVVTNVTVTEGAEVVADMAWGLMLAVSRQIPHHDRQIRAGNLSRGMASTPWRKALGIIGLGNIGRAVARRAVGFEMQILAVEPQPDQAFVAEHNIRLVDLPALLAQSDLISLHVRLNDSTRGMIGYDQLRQMKSSAFLINTARRDLVVERDLERALSEDLLAGAGLDDPPADAQSPLLERDNVVFTTHLGNRARVGVDAVFRQAVQNAADVLEGRRCSHIINPAAIGRRSS